MTEYVATWEGRPKRGVFAGLWRVQAVPEGHMLSCSSSQIWSATRQGIKDQLRSMANGHPVRFEGC